VPTLPAGTTLDFLRKQVVTARNVRGGRWVDFASMPQPNLRHAKPIVQDFCVARGISYAECGLLRSYGHVLLHLHAVGAPLRAAQR
jgi:hypothetical protein